MINVWLNVLNLITLGQDGLQSDNQVEILQFTQFKSKVLVYMQQVSDFDWKFALLGFTTLLATILFIINTSY